MFDGNGNQVVYMIPSANLMIRDAFRNVEGDMPVPQSMRKDTCTSRKKEC